MGTNDGRALGSVSDPELAVFVSGVASMGLEILAGRLVAPQFGSSIYTWGSVIGVFLAALSLGYYQGGNRATARASSRRLTWLLLGTAAYVAGLILAGDMLLLQLSSFPVPPRFASLPAITVLFGPPTYLLGFISPYAAELSDREGKGEASGRVYAVGTVGSIVGAFGTTFVLIPALSVDQISLTIGLLLVLTAARVARPSPGRKPAFAIVAVALLLGGAVLAPSVGYSVRGEIVYETQTPYQELRVVDAGDTRTLYLDGTPHSAMDRDDPTRHVFEYTRYFHLPFLVTDDPDDVDRVLFIGGGGFTGPRRFVEEYDVTVDVAEIDPDVIDAAERYFGVEEGERLNVHNVGGRQFLRETNRTYDVIVLDAYKRDKVPFQLTTVEFMRLTRERLADDGVLVANLISAPSGPASEFYRAEYATVAEAYPQVYAFPTVGSSVVQNIELVATADGERLSRAELRERDRERDIGIDLSDAIADYEEPPDTGDVPVLRDDDAPVDSLLEPMAGQRYVVEEADDSDTSDGSAPSENGSERPAVTSVSARVASSSRA